MKRSIFIILLLSIFIPCLIAERSYAVPSFARQTGKSCSGCHTVWPRLNITGREFKVTAYTDVAEDYQRIEKDTLDLLRYGPLSLSIITLPYTKTTGQRAETNIPDEVALFYAGRITPEIGAFIEPILAPEFEFEFAKIAWYSRLGEHTIGIVGGKMDAGGADPYNTIRFTAYHTINMPAILERQDTISGEKDLFSFSSTKNQGIVFNGRFFQTLYGAVGAFRGHENNDPWDLFVRLAEETPVGAEANLMIGGFVYKGKERYDHSADSPPGPVYKSDVRRLGLDAQFQMESGPHSIDAVALYMNGKDEDLDGISGKNIEFKGFYVEGSYFYERKYGITIGYDYVSSDDDNEFDKKGPTINLSYLPWLNTKIAIEYSKFRLADNKDEEVTSLLVHLYF